MRNERSVIIRRRNCKHIILDVEQEAVENTQVIFLNNYTANGVDMRW